MAPPRENSPFRLMVEGEEDKHAILHLVMRHGVDWEKDLKKLPYVFAAGSDEEILMGIQSAAKTYVRLGVVIDADESAADRFKQIGGRLKAAGIAVPDSPESVGVVVPGLRPDSRLGFWVMPDNQSTGSIEHFVTRLVPRGDGCIAHAEQATAEAKKLGAPFKNPAKANIHTWLAWRDPPGLSFGRALTAKELMHDSPDALRFVDWFKRLFLQ